MIFYESGILSNEYCALKYLVVILLSSFVKRITVLRLISASGFAIRVREFFPCTKVHEYMYLFDEVI